MLLLLMKLSAVCFHLEMRIKKYRKREREIITCKLESVPSKDEGYNLAKIIKTGKMVNSLAFVTSKLLLLESNISNWERKNSYKDG